MFVVFTIIYLSIYLRICIGSTGERDNRININIDTADITAQKRYFKVLIQWTIYLSQRAQVAVSIFFVKSPVVDGFIYITGKNR